MLRIAVASGLLLVAARAHADRTAPDSLLAKPVVAVSGGVEGFINLKLRDLASAGSAWSARVSAGERQGVRLELAYVGSAQGLDPASGTTLLGTGVVGTLRINVAPWVSDRLEPFLFVGGGWTRFHVRGAPAVAMGPKNDDVLDLPIGVGVAALFGRFVLDLRAGLTVTAGADLVPVDDPSSSRDSQAMHRFGVTAGLGMTI
jgi:hypothetical protein